MRLVTMAADELGRRLDRKEGTIVSLSFGQACDASRSSYV
jgi:hypothetical protein